MSEPYINAEEINDRAKLMMHRLIARQLVSDNFVIDRARQRLDFLRSQGRQNTYIDEWDRLLDLEPERLRRLITMRTEDMTRLRISSPLPLASGLFIDDEALRRRIHRKAKLGLELRALSQASLT